MGSVSAAEWLGYLASAMIVLSLVMRSVVRLRVINLGGALLFTVYGVVIDAPPVWVANGAIVLIDLWHLRGLLRREEHLELVDARADASLVRRFLDFHAERVQRDRPGFDGPRGDHRATLLLRDLEPAGLALWCPGPGDDELWIDLHLAAPSHRDRAAADFLQAELARREGAEVLLAASGSPRYDRRLARLGFERTEGHLRRTA